MTRVFAPSTVDEAVALLGAWPGARCVAGGANLVAAINAGEIAPPVLVGLQRVAGLAGVTRLADGSVRIGAMTRHVAVGAAAELVDGQRVVAAAASVIANPVVRNMGTIGGSVANADPAADYPTALVACGAAVEIIGPAGARAVAAAEFFPGGGVTALTPGELVVAVVVPAAAGAVGVYRKLRRTHGDYAMASVALVLGMEEGVVTRFACAIGGCGPAPVRLAAVEARLVGKPLSEAAVAEAGAALVAACEPVDDIRASAAYRRMVVPRLFASTVAEACGLLCVDA